MQQQVDFWLRRKQLEQIFNELIDTNARDEGFLGVQDPDPAQVADWKSRRGRMAQIVEEFQTLVQASRKV
jgi:hypothetical protein